MVKLRAFITSEYKLLLLKFAYIYFKLKLQCKLFSLQSTMAGIKKNLKQDQDSTDLKGFSLRDFDLELSKFFTFPGNCLYLSLARFVFYRHYTDKVELKIGVTAPPDFKAHAWLVFRDLEIAVQQITRDANQEYEEIYSVK